MRKCILGIVLALIQLGFTGQVLGSDVASYSLSEFPRFVPGDLVFENRWVGGIGVAELDKKRLMNIGFASSNSFSIGEFKLSVESACELGSAEPYFGKLKRVKKNASFEKWAKKNKVDSFAYVIAYDRGEKVKNVACDFSGNKASFRLAASPELIKLIESEIELRKLNYQRSLAVTIESKFDPGMIKSTSLVSCRPLRVIDRCHEVSTNFYETSLNGAANLKKGPYESSAQFETRKKDEVRGKSESHWVISWLTANDYDADKQSIKLGDLGKDRTLQEDVKVTNYTGENSFGVQKDVMKWRGSKYEANVEVPQSFTNLSLVDYISYSALLPFDSKEFQKREGRLAVASKVSVFADNSSSDRKRQSPTIHFKTDKDINVTTYRAVLERLFIFDFETYDIIYELKKSTKPVGSEVVRTVRVPSSGSSYVGPMLPRNCGGGRIKPSPDGVVLNPWDQASSDCRGLVYLDSDGKSQSVSLQPILNSPGHLSVEGSNEIHVRVQL
jgi:hypothetical protein